jgi:hypothetical protein
MRRRRVVRTSEDRRALVRSLAVQRNDAQFRLIVRMFVGKEKGDELAVGRNTR